MGSDLILESKVVKSNTLTEASYRLNIWEQRTVAYLISLISKKDKDFKTYEIEIKNLYGLSDSNHKDPYYQVKKLTRALLSKVLEIPTPEGVLQVTWLSSARYRDGEGIVELCFDPQLKPYLVNLKDRFTAYAIKNITKLKSRYSVRIYELLKQYQKLGKRSFDIHELRQLLGLKPSEYSTWFDFKRRVLTPAEKELPQKTDICFSYTTSKRGRSISHVTFSIWSKKEGSKTLKSTNTRKREAPKKEVKGGLTEEQRREQHAKNQALMAKLKPGRSSTSSSFSAISDVLENQLPLPGTDN